MHPNLPVRLKLALAHGALFAALVAVLGGVYLGGLALTQGWPAVDEVLAALEPASPLLAIGCVAAVAAMALGSWAISSRELSPLARLAEVARQISQSGDFSRRAPQPRARDEVGRVVETFNALVARVESVLDSQRQFLADTSHELRNPLTVIRGNLDLLQRDLDPETRRECATEAREEAARMSRLVADLLFLSQAEADRTIHQQPLRLDALLADVVERMRPLLDGRALEVSPLDATTINGDADRLQQLIVNLLDNAIRYTAPGGHIQVSLTRQGPEARLVVRDTGIGIPAAHLPRIFDRFYRVDPARSRAAGGTGLGLSIVKHVAEAHGGCVLVKSEPGKGSEFTVVLRAEPSWSAAAAG